jgi:hypothetical protein
MKGDTEHMARDVAHFCDEERAEDLVPIENGQPMTIVINLSSNGDVRVVSKAEILNTVDLGKEEP